VRIKLELNPDGSIVNTEILDHARMNKPGQSFYKVLAESALRAVKLCQPLKVPATGFEFETPQVGNETTEACTLHPLN